MAESITIARPYAKAAFEAARETGALDQWSVFLALAAAAAVDEKIEVVLDHPTLTREQKAQTLAEVCGDTLTTGNRNFLFALAANNRLQLLPVIAELFEAFKAQLEQTVEVEIESAFELGTEQQDKLAQALRSKLDRQINISARVNRELIGGAIVRTQDLVIDGSVRGKLAKLAEKLSA
jgi:F-type H+-transporting ATPase subunit delta